MYSHLQAYYKMMLDFTYVDKPLYLPHNVYKICQ